MVSTENNKTYFVYMRIKYNGDDVFRYPIRRCHLRLISVKRLMEKYYCSYIWPSIFLLVVGDVLTKNSTIKDFSYCTHCLDKVYNDIYIYIRIICIGEALQNMSLLSIRIKKIFGLQKVGWAKCMEAKNIECICLQYNLFS